MKKTLFSLLAGIACIGSSFASTSYISNIENAHAYKVIKVVLDGNTKIALAAVPSGSPAQPLQTLMNGIGGTWAINGGFFCPDEAAYSRCEGNTTDLIRKSNGILYSKWKRDVGSNKSVFGFDQTGVPLFVSDDGTYKEETAVDNVYNGLSMPTLVKDGKNVAIYNTEMNNDPKQSKSTNKSFICSTPDKSTIYMGYVDGVTFSSLADYIIQTFNCYSAIQLDNGLKAILSTEIIISYVKKLSKHIALHEKLFQHNMILHHYDRQIQYHSDGLRR